MRTQTHTEPIPATDAEIKRWHEVAAEVRNRNALEVPNRFISMDIRLTGLLELLARIEQEREMRRELAGHVDALLGPFRVREHLRDNCFRCKAEAAIARAAKMEVDNAR